MKKIFTMLLSTILIFCTIPTVGAEEQLSSSDSYFEVLSVDDAYADADIVNYIADYCSKDAAVAQAVEEEFNSNYEDQLLERLNKGLVDAGLEPTTKEKIREFNEKFDLENEAKEFIENSNSTRTDVLVLRDIETASVRSIWYITYYTTDSSFSMKVLELGSPLDRISGRIFLYGYSGRTWLGTYKDYDNFVVTNVTNGTFYTWSVPVYYVKEKFEYSITVTEGSTIINYTNVGEDDQCRYNFVAGSYTSIEARGGERHHFVSREALSAYGYNTNNAYCIRMIQADHYNTASHGNSDFVAEEKAYFANGDYEGLIDREVLELKAEKDSEGEYMSLWHKYYDEVFICYAAYAVLFGVT